MAAHMTLETSSLSDSPKISLYTSLWSVAPCLLHDISAMRLAWEYLEHSILEVTHVPICQLARVILLAL